LVVSRVFGCLHDGTQYARFSVVPVICMNCGNVILVSAEFSGIMPEE
jgi:ribosomal protein S27E